MSLPYCFMPDLEKNKLLQDIRIGKMNCLAEVLRQERRYINLTGQELQNFNEKRANKVVTALLKKDFEALYVPDKASALKEVINRIPEGARVGIGGSVTLRQIGLPEELKKRGHVLYDHWQGGLTQEELDQIRKQQLTCDVFLTGTNAITADGKLVNTDFTGNRVASMIFGPGKVIVVAGINKVVTNLEAALERIKNEASPKNALRLGFSTPCAGATFCTDCSGTNRLCRVTTIIEARPKGILDYTVIIAGENLGF